MSDTEGTKKSGYRLEYASSSRAKCKGWRIMSHLILIVATHASDRSQTVLWSVVAFEDRLILLTRIPDLEGSVIQKDTLRFGTVVDFRGNTTLYVAPHDNFPYVLFLCHFV
jgi:hypothetical protein